MLKNTILSIIMIAYVLFSVTLLSYSNFNTNVHFVTKNESQNIANKFTLEKKNKEPIKQEHIVKNIKTCIYFYISNEISQDSDFLHSPFSADNGLSFFTNDSEILTAISDLPKNDIVDKCLREYILNAPTLEDLNQRQELIESYGL